MCLTFENLPQFKELVCRARSVLNVGCELRLHGRYDMGENRPVDVMLYSQKMNESYTIHVLGTLD
jgi:hypothetical protein